MHKYFAKLNEIHLAVDVVTRIVECTRMGDRSTAKNTESMCRTYNFHIGQLAMTFMDYEDREAGASESRGCLAKWVNSKSTCLPGIVNCSK